MLTPRSPFSVALAALALCAFGCSSGVRTNATTPQPAAAQASQSAEPGAVDRAAVPDPAGSETTALAEASVAETAMAETAMAERDPAARTIVLEPELVATESDAAEMRSSPPADGLVELPSPRPGLQISWPLRACGFDHARAILRDELVCLGGDQPFLSASDEELEDAQLAVTRRPDGQPHLAIYIAPCYGGDVEVYVDVTCGG